MTELKEAPKPKTTNGPSTVKETVPSPKPAVPAISGGSPFAFMRRFTEEMDRLFEDFGIESRVHFPSLFTRGRELVRRETGLVPAAGRPGPTSSSATASMSSGPICQALPGTTFKVEITYDSVLIQGERKTQKKEEVEGCTYSECSYGSFYCAIPLPAGSESSQATAEFTNGVLEIVVPCSRPIEPKKRRLEIKGGK